MRGRAKPAGAARAALRDSSPPRLLPPSRRRPGVLWTVLSRVGLWFVGNHVRSPRCREPLGSQRTASELPVTRREQAGGDGGVASWVLQSGRGPAARDTEAAASPRREAA